MNKLKKIFDALHDKFTRKKPIFEKVLDKWHKRGKKSWYDRGRLLLDQLEKEGNELKALFADTGRAIETAAVKARIKLFKKRYKELSESTKSSWQQWTEALVFAGVVALVLRHFIFGLYHVPTGSAEPGILVGDRVWGNKLAYYFGEVKRGDLVIFDDPRFKYDENSIQASWQKYIGFPIPLLGLKSGPINVVKRVIACPGDWIEGRVEDDKTVIYLNGKKLDEPYVNPYPLVVVERQVGFFPIQSLGPLPIPSFLQRQKVYRWYTYVPDKRLDEQPYYNMSESEVVRVQGVTLIRKPFEPYPGGEDVFGPMRVPDDKYWVMGDSRKNSEDSRWFGFLDRKYIHGRFSFIIYSVDSEEPLWLFELVNHPIDFWLKSIRWNRFFKFPKAQ
jgi:signal peptidase I